MFRLPSYDRFFLEDDCFGLRCFKERRHCWTCKHGKEGKYQRRSFDRQMLPNSQHLSNKSFGDEDDDDDGQIGAEMTDKDFLVYNLRLTISSFVCCSLFLILSTCIVFRTFIFNKKKITNCTLRSEVKVYISVLSYDAQQQMKKVWLNWSEGSCLSTFIWCSTKNEPPAT